MPRVKTFCEEDVLNKAMELFWKKGFHATSISDLVKHLKINRASLYDTYGGKKELFNKAFLLYRNKNKARIISFLDEQPSVKEGLSNLFELAIIESISDNDHKGCFVVNATTEMATVDPEISATLAKNKSQFEQIFLDHLKKGVERNEISPEKDLRSIATLLITFYNGLMVVAKVEPDHDKLMSAVHAGLAVLD